MNQCNLRMLRAWRGNCDVQLLADPLGTLQYVTMAVNYASKTAEPLRVRMDTKFRAMLRALPPDTSLARQVAKAFNARMGLDQVSSQKAVAFLLGPGTWIAKNSERFVRVLAYPKHKSTRTVRDAAELVRMDARDTAVFKGDPMSDAYVRRPRRGAVANGSTGKLVRWRSMTEAYFREWFVRAPQGARTNRVRVGSLLCRQLSKPQILVVTPVINGDPRDEDSAYALLRLHVSHRGDVYDGHTSAVRRLKAIGVERLSREGRAVMGYAKATAENRARMRDAAERDVAGLDDEEDEEAAQYVDTLCAEDAGAAVADGNAAFAAGVSAFAPGIARASDHVLKLLSKYVTDQQKQRQTSVAVADARFDERRASSSKHKRHGKVVARLGEAQRAMYDYARAHISGAAQKPMAAVVYGKAGTGKSVLLDAISDFRLVSPAARVNLRDAHGVHQRGGAPHQGQHYFQSSRNADGRPAQDAALAFGELAPAAQLARAAAAGRIELGGLSHVCARGQTPALGFPRTGSPAVRRGARHAVRRL
jgi:hypothetical protein